MGREFEVGGQTYRAEKLDVFMQFRVSRRLAPLLVGLMKTGKIGKRGLDVKAVADLEGDDMLAMAEAFVQGLASLQDDDVDYILNACLDKTMRKSAGAWAPMRDGGKLMFEDLDMPGLLTIAWQVLQHNLHGFFTMLPQGSPGESQT